MTLSLPVSIRANSKAQFPVLTRTVEDAIDAIQRLPDEIRFKPHWAEAEDLLFKADENRGKEAIRSANLALSAALNKEGWLRVTGGTKSGIWGA